MVVPTIDIPDHSLDSNPGVIMSSSSSSSSSPPTPLAFQFRGYSIWLELENLPEEQQDDNNHPINVLDEAISLAATIRHVQRIPEPHVTVLYGIEEDEQQLDQNGGANASTTTTSILERFQKLRDIQQLQLSFGKEPLVPVSYKMDVSYDGVDGQDMDMTWMEITYANQDWHQANVNIVRDIMIPSSGTKDNHHHHISTTTNTSPDKSLPPWTPHLSIFYENPGPILDTEFADAIVAKFPALLLPRRPIAMSLWSTQGTMSNWKRIDRFPFFVPSSIENSGVLTSLDITTPDNYLVPTVITNNMVATASEMLEEGSMFRTTEAIEMRAS
jgi:hypothetical protein